MISVDLNQLQMIQHAISDIVEYETDNSCGDPECCGGPWGSKEASDEGIDLLRKYGIVYTPET